MSGIGTLKLPKLIDDFKRLGFPEYFRKQIAISKIMGSIVLIIPFLPNTIKEWTYIGFVILLCSSLVAHFSSKKTNKIKCITSYFIGNYYK